VGAILIEGPNRRTHFWKRTIQGDEIKKKSSLKLVSQSQPNFAEMILGWSPFKNVSVSAVLHQNFVLIEQMVSDKKIFMGISHRVLC
jgi:hypothetical protein